MCGYDQESKGMLIGAVEKLRVDSTIEIEGERIYFVNIWMAVSCSVIMCIFLLIVISQNGEG